MRPTIKRLLYALQRFLPRRHGAVILGYHSVGNFDEPYTVSLEEMDWQLAEIKRQGLKVIRLSDLEAMMDAGTVEDKTVVLTFDDGRDDNYTNLFPLLRKHNVPATIFSITGFIGKTRESSVRSNPMLSIEQMEEMQRSGLVDFQPHTVTHPKLTKITLEQVRQEVSESKKVLEGIFHKRCTYFAYPYGRHSDEIKSALQDLGITLAVCGLPGFADEKSDRMALPRAEIRRTTSHAEFISKLHRGSLR